MNPPRFHEAVKAAQELLAKMPAVRSAILFGSTARGSATEDSDIDLFIECNAEREEEVARALYGIEGVFNVRFGPTFFRQKGLASIRFPVSRVDFPAGPVNPRIVSQIHVVRRPLIFEKWGSSETTRPRRRSAVAAITQSAMGRSRCMHCRNPASHANSGSSCTTSKPACSRALSLANASARAAS